MTTTGTSSETQTSGTPVVVCTAHRGVFFGYLQNTVDKDRIAVLRSARNAYYWRCEGGFMELGHTGPKAGSKVGPRADITLTEVTAVIACADAAVAAWEAAKWN